MTIQAPKTLNGYPVIRTESHRNCATVLVDAPGKYIVATWSPETGNGWIWGHYFHVDGPDKQGAKSEVETFKKALSDFADTAYRNATR